jgi:hypothetical protein
MAAFADALALDVQSAGLQIDTVIAAVDEPLLEDWLAALHANAGAS